MNNYYGQPIIRVDTLARWHRRYWDLAHLVATWSKDPSSRVGAVLVGANRKCIAHGYNGFPPGIADTEERLADREVKYRLIQHAERNVLDNAQFPTAGSTLVATMFPCHECAKSVVSKGVIQVICPLPLDREPWRTSAQWTKEMFDEAGVALVQVAPPIVVPEG